MTPTDITSPDDFALMERIRSADPAALEIFWKLHAGLVMAIGLKSLGSRQEAEDLTVDVFHELWRKRDRYDSARASPRTYLVTLARSRALDRLRSRGVQPATVPLQNENVDPPAPAAGSPAAAIETDEQRQRVRAALRSLEPMQRIALEAAYYQGLSHTEIATLLHKPLGTVKGYIRLAMIHLRDCLRKYEEDAT